MFKRLIHLIIQAETSYYGIRVFYIYNIIQVLLIVSCVLGILKFPTKSRLISLIIIRLCRTNSCLVSNSRTKIRGCRSLQNRPFNINYTLRRKICRRISISYIKYIIVVILLSGRINLNDIQLGWVQQETSNSSAQIG